MAAAAGSAAAGGAQVNTPPIATKPTRLPAVARRLPVLLLVTTACLPVGIAAIPRSARGRRYRT
ncbi:hypothetical protein GCM10009799_01060 [Nocardiopsis rhodophaea]|uniref:Uncharacterized protein n=1 Tax=Nocardiopsis rhodophaea TaxID=280238 RepID=A0ABN2S3F0_9ACTN